MKRFNPNILVAVASCIGVLALVVKDVERESPGDLSAVHGRIDDLELGQNCKACHGGGSVSADQACLDCHSVIEQHIATGEGLHGNLETQVQRACAMCHSEHHGPNFALVNTRSFMIAGFANTQEFDHRFVGFPMDGVHLEQDCQACHTYAAQALVPAGEHRYIGLDQDCSTCHEDPHGGQMQRACIECHNQNDFATFDHFEHGPGMDLVGAHASLDCADCHAENTPQSVEALAGLGPHPEARTCASCHDSPHSTPFLQGIADLAQAAQGPRGCVVCHTAEDQSFAFEEPAITPALHLASGFPLEAPHDDADCTQCHGPTDSPYEWRYLSRAANACAECHNDPHEGQFDTGPFAQEGCIACHQKTAFEPHAFTQDLHRLTQLPLEGAHQALECQACHPDPERGAARQFHGTPASCQACHEDVHGGDFDARGMQDCSDCHDSESFGGAHARAFDHGQWTGFALRGAHAQSDCEACHGTQEEAHAGRTLGRVSAHFGAIQGCVTCHKDPHLGAFDGGHLPQQVEQHTGCARCHSELSFRQATQDFEHGLWTGFPLSGAHGEASCATCHKRQPRPDQHGRTWGQAKGANCSDCHSDPHGGQFETQGVTDCATCHKASDSFTDLSFDHDLHSRFPLDETHRAVDCAQCHKVPKDSPDGIVKYKPLGTRCIDCHGSTRGPLSGSRPSTAGRSGGQGD